jgi:hypothetical protein
MNDSKSDHNTLWDLIKNIRFGMLTHRHNDGMLYSHPLTTQNKLLDQRRHFTSFSLKNQSLPMTYGRTATSTCRMPARTTTAMFQSPALPA